MVAVDGSNIDVAVPLHPEAPLLGPADQGAPDARARGSRVVPGVAIGVGAAAIVAGGLLIAFDQDPSPQQRYYYNTAPYGVASLAAGVAVAGVGVYLWLRPQASQASSVATVAPVPGGAAVGWAGRF